MNNKVVGISVSIGEYKGYNYKNLVLHMNYFGDQYTEGVKVGHIKVKYKNLNDVFNLNKTAAEIDNLLPNHFKNLIGKSLDVFYNQYREVIQIVSKPFEDDKPEKA